MYINCNSFLVIPVASNFANILNTVTRVKELYNDEYFNKPLSLAFLVLDIMLVFLPFLFLSILGMPQLLHFSIKIH